MNRTTGFSDNDHLGAAFGMEDDSRSSPTKQKKVEASGELARWQSTSADAMELDKLVNDPNFNVKAQPLKIFLKHARFHKYGLTTFRKHLNLKKKESNKWIPRAKGLPSKSSEL